jgi:hypothetical protein
VPISSGGPGSFSQPLILKEIMNRLEFEWDVKERTLYLIDHFELFGEVGSGP